NDTIELSFGMMVGLSGLITVVVVTPGKGGATADDPRAARQIAAASAAPTRSRMPGMQGARLRVAAAGAWCGCHSSGAVWAMSPAMVSGSVVGSAETPCAQTYAVVRPSRAALPSTRGTIGARCASGAPARTITTTLLGA